MWTLVSVASIVMQNLRALKSLFGYAINGGEVHVIDLALGEKIPEEILNAIADDSITKWAFNASFERVCLSYWLRKHYPASFTATAFLKTLLEVTLIHLLGAAV
jgi:hypothetical protein